MRKITAASLCCMVLVGLTGCFDGDPIANSGTSGSEAIVVGSQDYYSNEIIAEIYAQALESEGFTVARSYRIGQREAYLPEIVQGGIDVFPEYTGNLLQYWDSDTDARDEQDVYAQLQSVVPDGLTVLDDAKATDQDAYAVTADFAQEHGVNSIDDLAGLDGLVLGGNSELETRPYGPDGLKRYYGVDVVFRPIEDSAGPLTMKALRDGDINLVKVNTASPDIASQNLVVLDDSEHMLLASHVVPLVSDDLPQKARVVLNRVQAALDDEGLIAMNDQSVNKEQNAVDIAGQWLTDIALGEVSQ